MPCPWYRKVKLVLQEGFRKQKDEASMHFPCNLRCTLNLPPPSPPILRFHLFIVCVGGFVRCKGVDGAMHEVHEEIREQLGRAYSLLPLRGSPR